MKAPARTLKEGNLKWLVMVVTLDIAVILFSGFTAATTSLYRGVLLPLLPVVVLLLTNMIPHNVKDTLVYWKSKNALPGHQAFTKHGPEDPRVDMDALRKNVGPWPSDSAGQNSFWYKLYRQVEPDAAVVEGHKMYVLFRDMAALSALCLLLVPLSLAVGGAAKSCLISLGLFLVQYVVASLAARFNGVRFVRTVLAVHSAKSPRAARR